MRLSIAVRLSCVCAQLFVINYNRTLQQKYTLRRSRSFKIIDFGTDIESARDFLLVNMTTLHPISYRLPDIAQY